MSRWILLALTMVLLAAIAPFVVAQDANLVDSPPVGNAIDETPVMLADEELFVIQTQVGSFSVAE